MKIARFMPSNKCGPVFENCRRFVVLKGKHFLGNYVGVQPNRTREKLRRLEDGHANFAETESGEDFVNRLFNVIPQCRLRWKEVPCAANRLESSRLFFFFAAPSLTLRVPRDRYFCTRRNAAHK